MSDDLSVLLQRGADPPVRAILHGVSAQDLRAVQEAGIPVEYQVQTHAGESVIVPASQLALPPEVPAYA